MADVFLGSVYANLELRTASVKAAAEATRRQFDSVQTSANKVTFQSFTKNAAANLNSVADSIKGLTLTAVALGVTGGAGLGAMTKAAFDQVRQVQNASFGLRAYEKDAGKVNMVLKQLVDYAQSDMGVLFQRDDLFKAASNLRGFGVEADKVTGYVKILSKGVSLGMTNFDELSQILGRAANAGKLSAAEFDMLAQRGIILDRSFRGAEVTAEALFQELNRALPDQLLEGRANTIDGALIRLQSSFRNLGAQILGVNKDADGFVEGGVGDTMMKALDDLRVMLRDPAFVEAFQKMGREIAKLAQDAIPKLMTAAMWLAENFDKVIQGAKILGVAFVVLKAAAIGLNTLSTISGVVGVMVKVFKAGSLAVAGFNVAMMGGGGLIKGAGIFVNAGAMIGTAISGILKVGGLLLTFLKVSLLAGFKILSAGIMAIPVFGWIIAAVTAVVGILIWLWNTNEGFRNAIISAWNAILSFFGGVGSWFVGFGQNIAKVWQGFMSGVRAVGSFFATVWNGIVSVAQTVFGAIAAVYNATLKPVFDVIIYLVTAIGTIFGTIFMGILQVVTTVITTIVQILGVVLVGVLMWLWNNVLIPLGNAFASVWNWISTSVSTAANFIWGIITTVFTAVSGFVGGVMDFIGQAIVNGWNAVVAFMQPVLDWISNAVGVAFNIMSVVVSVVMSTVQGVIANVWGTIRGIISGAVEAVKGVVSAGFNFIRDAIVRPIQDAFNAVRDFAGKFLQAGKDIIDGIVKGVSNGKDAVVNKIKDICSGALDAVKSFFGIKSPSRVMAKMFGFVMQGAERGIDDNAKSFMDTYTGVFNNLPDVAIDTSFADASAVSQYTRAIKVERGEGFGNVGDMHIHGDVHIDKDVDTYGIVEQMNRGSVLAQKRMTSDV